MEHSYSTSDFRKVIASLKTLSLPGFAGFDVGHLLFKTVYMYMCSPHKPKLKSIVQPFFMEYRCEFEAPENKVLFYFSNYYAVRNDMRSIRDTVAANISDIARMQGKSFGKVFCLKRILQIENIFRWNKVLKKLDLDKALKRCLLIDLAYMQSELQFLGQNRDALRKAKMLLTMNDENYDENLIVQYFQSLGIPTVTLQHGHLIRTREDGDLNHLSHIFENITADYFFAWGEYTCRLAVQSGVSAEKLFPVGCPKYIDSSDKVLQTDRKIFGVVLDGNIGVFQDSNAELLSIADEIASRYGYRYILKIHPNDTPESFVGMFRKENLYKIMPVNSTVREFAGETDFAVAALSSVFSELLYLGIIVFRYASPKLIDYYENIETGKIEDIDSIEPLMDRFLHDNEAFHQDCAKVAMDLVGTNLTDNYANAIRKILNDFKEKAHV